MKLGGLILEPADVEVLTKEYILEYWMTRDVTINEVLILKVYAPFTLGTATACSISLTQSSNSAL